MSIHLTARGVCQAEVSAIGCRSSKTAVVLAIAPNCVRGRRQRTQALCASHLETFAGAMLRKVMRSIEPATYLSGLTHHGLD